MSSRTPGVLLAVLLTAVGSSLDVSATEFYANAVSGDDGNDGLTSATATNTVTAALALANDAGPGPHTVHVAPGTYDANLGEEFPFEPADGVSLVGVPADPAQVVIVLGEEDGHGVLFDRSGAGNVPLGTLVAGFTFFSDRIDPEFSLVLLLASGGDVVISPTIRNNVFSMRSDAEDSEPAIDLNAFQFATVSPRVSHNTIDMPMASGGLRIMAFDNCTDADQESCFATTSPVIDGNFITARAPVELIKESAGTMEPVITRNTITGTLSGMGFSTEYDASPIGGIVSNNLIVGSPAVYVLNYGGIATIFENNTLLGTDGAAALGVGLYDDPSPDLGGGAGGSLGHNTIQGDVANGADDLVNEGDAPMFAENNWWSDFPPTHIEPGPGVDADPANDPALAFAIDGSKTLATEVTITAGPNSFFVDRVGADETRLEVLFGGVPGGNVGVNATGTEITVQPPPGDGTVDVTVTNPAGQTGTLHDAFTLMPAVCADAPFPQCDLPCPDPNDICAPGPTGEECRCEPPLLVKLESFSATIGQGGVRVAWETSSEVDTTGFRVLRMRRPAIVQREIGRQTVIELEMTSPLIPARGSELSGARYEYLDRPGRHSGTLLYYLEELDFSAQVTLHGPVAVETAGPE